MPKTTLDLLEDLHKKSLKREKMEPTTKRKEEGGRYEALDTTYIDRPEQTKREAKSSEALKKARKTAVGEKAHKYGSALKRRMREAGLE